MSTNAPPKLRSVLEDWVPQGVVTYRWLNERGVSHDLARKYVLSGWLERLGNGTFKRPKESLTWHGALASLQRQTGLKIHAGALTALALEGNIHFARPAGETIFLFAAHGTTLPKWFRAYPWPDRITLTQTNLLPADMAVRETTTSGSSVLASSPERAILEALHLTPNQIDLIETYHILESLRTLRPKVMQSLLEACTSIKVKRLFLMMADQAGLPVMEHLDLSSISLGSGDRTITPGGVYVSKFRLTVPRELVAHE